MEGYEPDEFGGVQEAFRGGLGKRAPVPGGGELDGGGVGRFLICVGRSCGVECGLIIGPNELLMELAYNCCAKVSPPPDDDRFRGVFMGATASCG